MTKYPKDTPRWRTPWFIRKVTYAVLAIIMAVLFVTGVITEAQADQITAKLDQLLGYAVAFGGFMVATSKTGEGSDSTATATDVATALQQSATINPAMVTAAVKTGIDDALDRLGFTGLTLDEKNIITPPTVEGYPTPDEDN